MSYMIKEIFWSVKGEGFQAGTPALFIRFAGCNFWNGKEEDRESSSCSFCDTDFIGGERWEAEALADRAAELAGITEPVTIGGRVLCVLTGGEPLLQLDVVLAQALCSRGFHLSLETNGSIDPSPELKWELSWVCCSPKDLGRLQFRDIVDELKVVHPNTFNPEDAKRAILGLGSEPRRFYLQPMDGCDGATEEVVEYVKSNRGWRISTQCHKVWGIE